MKQKKRDVLFSILLVAVSGFVFFALGVTVAWKWGFPKSNVVIEYPVYDTGLSTTITTALMDKIDLNAATVAQLMQIEGIGEKTAQNIIEYREKIGKYTFLEQLLDVDGVGEKKLNAWKEFLTVEEIVTTSAASTTVTSASVESTTTTSIRTSVTSTTVFNGVLNLNTATKEELMLISGIGEATATKILEYRDAIGGFTSLEQLMDIEGIGEKKFAAWSRYLTLGD